ncbi:hypothetical protein KY290_027534 [Solanum tuberosum]|uniref:Uncharacterized protein n=1 Tax=Solanum tuberosum TaxID=4113 RepID=A0ABQ7UFF6_SOLTU|nr:hypothetical protein KY285_026471 [Solanum tuberosum]KAH0748302.1 hypothetical protein KY290_027534 [Solanum tuberosum]
MFLDTRLMVYENEVVEFYVNFNVLEGNVVTSSINGVKLVFDLVRLEKIFNIPTTGLSEYVWSKDVNCMLASKYSQGRVSSTHRKFLRGKMSLFNEFMYELVHKGVLPRGKKRHEASFIDMGIANALESKDSIDCPTLMIKHLARIADSKPGPHVNLLTTMFKAFNVPLGEGRALNRNYMFTRSTLAYCRLLVENN